MAAEKTAAAEKWETAVKAADEEKGAMAVKKGKKGGDKEMGATAARKGETGGDEENGATWEGKGATAVEKGEKSGSGASGDEGKGATAEGERKLPEDAVLKLSEDAGLKLSEEAEWKWKIAAFADGEEELKPRRERRRWRSTRRDLAAAADKKEEEVRAAAKEVAGEKPVFFFRAAAAGKKNDPVSSKGKLSEDAVRKLSEEAEWKWKIATPGGEEEVPKPRMERRRWQSTRREPAAADKGEAAAAAKEVAGEKKFFFFGAAADEKMINLMSKEGKQFKMSEAATRLSAVLADMIDHGCAGGNIPVPNVDAKSLATVIKYCDKHAAAAKPSSGSHHGAADSAGSSSSNSVNTVASEKTLAEWDRKLIDDLTLDALHDLIVTANFLDIKGLLEATCRKVADMMKGKTPAQIRLIFHITNDFTPGEEAEICKEIPWAFEDYEYLSQIRLQATHKNHKSWMAKSSNKEPLTPLSLSPQEHSKMKEHSHL
jgi:S-phase kinase-associated protein 1